MTDAAPMTPQGLSALRHDFHRFPELGFQEVRTKARIAELLQSWGLEVEVGTGVIGVLRRGSSSRMIGLRADMDALPIPETGTHGHVSEHPGVMHACGHDGHMVMLLGAAQALAQSEAFDGTVVFIFQPNEEQGLGAKAMLGEGLLARYPLEEIYAIHNLPGHAAGAILTRPGLICSSESLFEIAIEGRGGHASMPHTGRDALTVGAALVGSLQLIVARRLAPGSGAVVSVTEFLSDGQRNVLPARATLKGDARARSPEDRDAIERHMRQICDGLAHAHEVDIKVNFATEFVETINAPEQVRAVGAAAAIANLPVNTTCTPMSFSEDFAHFANAVPGCFLLLGNGVDGACAQPLHASDYDFNDALLPMGVAFWTALVTERLAFGGAGVAPARACTKN